MEGKEYRFNLKLEINTEGSYTVIVFVSNFISNFIKICFILLSFYCYFIIKNQEVLLLKLNVCSLARLSTSSRHTRSSTPQNHSLISFVENVISLRGCALTLREQTIYFHQAESLFLPFIINEIAYACLYSNISFIHIYSSTQLHFIAINKHSVSM